MAKPPSRNSIFVDAQQAANHLALAGEIFHERWHGRKLKDRKTYEAVAGVRYEKFKKSLGPDRSITRIEQELMHVHQSTGIQIAQSARIITNSARQNTFLTLAFVQALHDIGSHIQSGPKMAAISTAIIHAGMLVGAEIPDPKSDAGTKYSAEINMLHHLSMNHGPSSYTSGRKALSAHRHSETVAKYAEDIATLGAFHAGSLAIPDKRQSTTPHGVEDQIAVTAEAWHILRQRHLTGVNLRANIASETLRVAILFEQASRHHQLHDLDELNDTVQTAVDHEGRWAHHSALRMAKSVRGIDTAIDKLCNDPG